MTSKEFDFLSRVSNSFKWFCPKCEKEMKTSEPGDKLAEQGAKLEFLTEIIKTLQQQNDLILQLLTKGSRLEDKIKTHVREAIDEQTDVAGEPCCQSRESSQ